MEEYQSLFRTVKYSPSDALISRVTSVKEYERDSSYINTPNREFDDDTKHFFPWVVLFLEGGELVIYGVVLVGGEILSCTWWNSSLQCCTPKNR